MVMIEMIQPLHIGNALRLFVQPPAGAVRWKVLKNGSGVIPSHDDPQSAIAYEGDEKIFVDIAFLANDVMMFYRPFYTVDGIIWTAGPVASGTPKAIYEETTTDVLSYLRERLEAGLQVEVTRGNLVSEIGHIQVFNASPSLEQDLRLPVVTLHLENEAAGNRGIGEEISIDEVDAISGEVTEAEGWHSDVSVVIIGWSSNGDERLELRKAIRRIIIGNFPVFESLGWILPSLTQSDVDAVNGEYPAPMYQVMNTFTCTAPVRVGASVAPIADVQMDNNQP